eukprot:964187-Amphidinium_carterae.1
MFSPEQPSAEEVALALEVCCVLRVLGSFVDVCGCCMLRTIQKGRAGPWEHCKARPTWPLCRIVAACPQWRRTDSFL